MLNINMLTLISAYLQNNYNFLKAYNITSPVVFNSTDRHIPDDLEWDKLVYIEINNYNDPNLEFLQNSYLLKKLHIRSFIAESESFKCIHHLQLHDIDFYYPYDDDTYDNILSNTNIMHIKKLSIGGFNGNLEPFRGAPLKELSLHCYDTINVSNMLDPLQGAPLKKIYINSKYVTNLTPLHNMNNLEEIDFDEFNSDLVALEPLRGISLRVVKLRKFTGSLEPLMNNNSRLEILYLASFNGDLEPLRGAPLQKIQLNNFNGSLAPLQNAPLRKIYLELFSGSLEPLRGAPLRYIDMENFIGDLEPLRGAPIKKLHLGRFNGDLEPLRGAPIKRLQLSDFTGKLEPLQGMQLNEITMYKFNGDLNPIQGAPIKKLILREYNGDLSALVGAPLIILVLDNFGSGGGSSGSSGNASCSLAPLRGISSLQDLHIDSFTGDLTPLAELSSLKVLHMNSYNGTLEPLRNLPIRELYMNLFTTGNIEPLKKTFLKNIDPEQLASTQNYGKLFESISDYHYFAHFAEVEIN